MHMHGWSWSWSWSWTRKKSSSSLALSPRASRATTSPPPYKNPSTGPPLPLALDRPTSPSRRSNLPLASPSPRKVVTTDRSLSHHHILGHRLYVERSTMMSSSHHEAMLPYAPPPPPPCLLVDRRYKQVQGGGEVAPSCPRCDSPNTKFCYYNNYSLSQPRYFCKGCRRYWTKGGSLRNVPVGGGCRKNRRSKSSSSSALRSAADATAFGGHHRFPAVRPDLVLEGMAGNSSPSANPAAGHEIVPGAAAADGSTIDLAMLYAKFLSHPPPAAEDGVTPPESAGQHVADEAFDASSDLSPGSVLAPVQFDGFGEWSAAGGPVSCSTTDPSISTASTATATTTMMQCADDVSVQAALGELSFAMDHQISCCGFDSLGLPTTDDDVVGGGNLSSWCSIVPGLSTLEDSFPDDALSSLHEGMIIGGTDHDWSVVDCQGLEALYMP